MSETIGIVGLGVIAGHHVRALEMTPGVEVIGGVDVDPKRTLSVAGERKPVYGTVEELLDRSPSCVIVATPTPTHYDVAMRILKHDKPPRRLIVEKPLVSSLKQLQDLVASRGDIELDGVYHMAHAPEVLWAMEHWAGWRSSLGRVVNYQASFADPYGGMRTKERRTYVNSWFDSGINALSVSCRFVRLIATEHLNTIDERRSVFEASVSFEDAGGGGLGTIRTTWDAAEPAKHSEFTFESGATVYLDHQAIYGILRQNGTIIDRFRYMGDMPRLQLHYKNAFRSLFVDRAGYYTLDESLALHRLLFEYDKPAVQYHRMAK